MSTVVKMTSKLEKYLNKLKISFSGMADQSRILRNNDKKILFQERQMEKRVDDDPVRGGQCGDTGRAEGADTLLRGRQRAARDQQGG